MTKPITDRPLKKRGPKLKQAPANLAALVEAFAADGWSLLGIAKQLGTSTDVLRRWMDENPDLKEALDQGREAERYALHNMLFRRAIEKGDTTAAMFLLKSRHGYREGDQSEQGNRVSINFQLPAALSLENFKVIEHATATDRLERFPTSGAAGS